MHQDVKVVPQGFTVRLINLDSESFEGPDHEFNVVIHQRKKEVYESLPFFRTQDTNNSEIQKDDVSLFCYEKVTRVRVTVEESIFKDHLEVSMESPDSDFMGVKTHRHYCFPIINPDSFDKLHDHQVFR